jgi:anti-anti-sigma regulatory factor
MNIDIYKKGKYQVLRFKEDVGLNADLSELKFAIEGQISHGETMIAVAFTPRSYLYTKSIAVLISCSEIIKDAGGHLAIVEANRDILDIFSVIDFDKMIKICKSEEDLLENLPSSTQQ